MTYNKLFKPTLLATAAVGLSFASAQAAFAHQHADKKMHTETQAMTSDTHMQEKQMKMDKMDTTWKSDEVMDPSLIKQNIGELDSASDVTTAIDNANTMGDFTLALEKSNHDETLMSDGLYTVFVPRDSAFWQVEGQQYVDWMNSPEVSNLDSVVKTHIVKGELMSGDLVAKLKNSPDGKVKLTTLNGETLTAWQENGFVQISDSAGNIGQVTTADIDQSNGVIHVINQVLEPAM